MYLNVSSSGLKPIYPVCFIDSKAAGVDVLTTPLRSWSATLNNLTGCKVFCIQISFIVIPSFFMSGVVNCHLIERFVLALQRGVRFGSPFIQCWAWQQGCNVLWLPIIGVRCFTIALYTISDRTVRYGSSAAFYRWVQSVFPIFGKQVLQAYFQVRW